MTESSAPVTGSVISGPDAQAAIWFLGALAQVRLSGEQTGGAFALADHLAQRGSGFRAAQRPAAVGTPDERRTDPRSHLSST